MNIRLQAGLQYTDTQSGHFKSGMQLQYNFALVEPCSANAKSNYIILIVCVCVCVYKT